MSRFRVNIDKLGLLLLPTALRKELMYAWVKAIGAPLKTIYSAFMAARDGLLFLLQFDSSKYDIERYLNTVFSDGGDEIYITLAPSSDTLYLTEHLPFFINDPEAYGQATQVYLPEFTDFYLDVVDRGVDFTVHIPDSLNGRSGDIEAAVSRLALPGYEFDVLEYLDN